MMRFKSTIAFLLLVFVNGVTAQSSLEDLKRLKWSNRIILVSSDEYLEQIVHQFESQSSGIIDRDILWFSFQDDYIQTNYSGEIAKGFSSYINTRYFSEIKTGVVLLGKDGGVKGVADELNLRELFALIDGMPMRRAEIENSSR